PPLSTLFPYTTLFRSVRTEYQGSDFGAVRKCDRATRVARNTGASSYAEPTRHPASSVWTTPNTRHPLPISLTRGVPGKLELRRRSEEHTSELQSRSDL